MYCDLVYIRLVGVLFYEVGYGKFKLGSDLLVNVR